ncbi:hypothetical protein [Pontiella agarivorans]|uniref:DUF642 domain-containing protein n=1 Tax=Pontiella agarivorans TaxID=3038953 RepID=A0ABU5MXY4_9BACT|nr:hypothetical protein [Pontiella agarivorans]MDZ8119064.1 hypothetical protein [Pontiella agarivorans]
MTNRLLIGLAMAGVIAISAQAQLYSEDFEQPITRVDVGNGNAKLNTDFQIGEWAYTDLNAGNNGNITTVDGSTAIIQDSGVGQRGMVIAIDASTWSTGNKSLSFKSTSVSGANSVYYGIFSVNANADPIVDLGKGGGAFANCGKPSPAVAELKEIGAYAATGTTLTNFTWTAGAADTLMLVFNSGDNSEVGLDDIVIDDAAATGPATVGLSPDSELVISVTHPATVANNDLVVTYIEGGALADGQIESVNIYSNGFSLVGTYSFPIALSDSDTAQFDIQFDAAAVGVVNGASANRIGLAEVIWSENGGGTYTNTIALDGDYNNPPFDLDIGDQVGGADQPIIMTMIVPDSAVTNTVAVNYTEGPAHTNAQISSIVFSNATHIGFSADPASFELSDPAPSTTTFNLVFDNSVAGLTHKQSASADMVVTYNELGGPDQTSVIPVSVSYYNPPVGVIQLNMGESVNVVNDSVYGNRKLNEFDAYTNQFNIASGGSQDTSNGRIQVNSGATNIRALWNLVESGTAGMDNFGEVDTVPLTNGLYQYQFDYEVVNNSGAEAYWSIDAYALIDQGSTGTVDYVQLDDSEGTLEKRVPVAQGLASFSQHSGGILTGSGNVSRSSGAVTVNVTNGYDSIFIIQGAGGTDVRIYDLSLVRIGDFEVGPPPFNSPNAVVAATFDDANSTNAIISGLDLTDLNNVTDTNGVSIANTFRGNNLARAGKSLQSTVSPTAGKVNMLLVRAGTSGYDDVGFQDTIALSEGVYDLTFDVDTTPGNFSTNTSSVGVDLYALSGIVVGDANNTVRIGHQNKDGNGIQTFGAASKTLLASVSYTNDFTGTVTLSNMNVLAGQDVLIVLRHQEGPDPIFDNIELVRTGDLASTGYDAWVILNGLYGPDADLQADLENGGAGDGLNNLMEYALGGDPNVADSGIVLQQSVSGGVFQHVYNERTDDESLTFTVELDQIRNLSYADWQEEGLTETRGVDDGTFQTVTNTTDTLESVNFIRLKVDKN